MDEQRKMIFDELVNEINFLERTFKDYIETIYAKLERLKNLDVIVEKKGCGKEDDVGYSPPLICGKGWICLKCQNVEKSELLISTNNSKISNKKGCGKPIFTGVPPFKMSCSRPCGSDPNQLCDDCRKPERNVEEDKNGLD